MRFIPRLSAELWRGLRPPRATTYRVRERERPLTFKHVFFSGEEPSSPGVLAINTGGLEVQIYVLEQGWSENRAQLKAVFYNNLPVRMENFQFTVAVTKGFDIEMQQASGTSLPAMAEDAVVQMITVTRKSEGPVSFFRFIW